MTVSKTVTTSTATSTEKGLTPAFDYVELLGRSNFSFLQGASHPEEMVKRARELGYRGLALCDVNGLYGVVRAYQEVAFPSHFLATPLAQTQARPFHCLSGAEMQLRDGGAVSLLPMNKEGYTRLCQLITLSKREVPKNYSGLTAEQVCAHNEDLIALLLPPWTPAKLDQFRQAFQDRLYLPVWKDLTWQSLDFYRQALDLERRQGFKLVVSQRPFMHHPQRKPLHDVLTALLHGTTLKAACTRLLANRQRHLQTLPDLLRLWQERPDLLTQSARIAERVHFDLSELRYQYPQAACPPGLSSTEYLHQLTVKGLQWRYPNGAPPQVRAMAERELSLIHELAYEDYFLTLHDVCEFARRQKILFQGRGSAANSVVCFALGLTAVDPTAVDLLFERFISKERGEPPDIDIDFEHERREEVIQYIYRHYGPSHAAMVCTVICYRSRMAIRDVAKTFGLESKIVDDMIKFMGREGLERLKENPGRAAAWGLNPTQFQLLLRLAFALKGFPRHLGIHTGGFVVSQRPITECVPVEKATMDQRFVVQWNKDDLTVLKMMKIDVLSLGMLSALRRCFDSLNKEKQIDWNLATLPVDDKKTYDMIQKADTVGVFQIESRAQMSLLPRLKPKCFYDLVVEVAIIRPGPIQGGMVHPYVRRRHGQEPVTYAHPDLKPILAKTFGVPIFQEQIMQIASAVAGFSPGEADELRRIMSSSWKKSELMQGLRSRLINGMLAHGIEIEYAERIYQTIVGFASYGFPESHAASFALLTYASSYLKCHHPDVFVCALLNSQPMGFYSPRALIADAQRHGVDFLPLDLQKSNYEYSLEPVADSKRWAVRMGFAAIFGLQKRHIDRLLKVREEQGAFSDLMDFVRRAQIPKGILLRLAAAGALRTLGLEPRPALWQIQALEFGEESLFFGSGRENHAMTAESGDLPQESDWDRLTREFRAQGFSLKDHPIGLWRRQQKKSPAQSRIAAAQLLNCANGQHVRLAGLLSLVQRPPTAKGFAFLSMEDETGLFNVVLTPQVYECFRLTIASNPLLEVSGRLEKVQGVANLKAESLVPLRF